MLPVQVFFILFLVIYILVSSTGSDGDGEGVQMILRLCIPVSVPPAQRRFYRAPRDHPGDNDHATPAPYVTEQSSVTQVKERSPMTNSHAGGVESRPPGDGSFCPRRQRGGSSDTEVKIHRSALISTQKIPFIKLPCIIFQQIAKKKKYGTPKTESESKSTQKRAR